MLSVTESEFKTFRVSAFERVKACEMLRVITFESIILSRQSGEYRVLTWQRGATKCTNTTCHQTEPERRSSLGFPYGLEQFNDETWYCEPVGQTEQDYHTCKSRVCFCDNQHHNWDSGHKNGSLIKILRIYAAKVAKYTSSKATSRCEKSYEQKERRTLVGGHSNIITAKFHLKTKQKRGIHNFDHTVKLYLSSRLCVHQGRLKRCLLYCFEKDLSPAAALSVQNVPICFHRFAHPWPTLHNSDGKWCANM